LAAVQRRRQRPVWFIQAAGAFAQRNFLPAFLRRRGERPFRVPWWARRLFRVPRLRDLPSRFVGLGLWREHVKT
jgi:hypothetical protein